MAAVVFKTIVDQFVGRLNLLRVYSGRLRSDSTVYNSTKGQRERIGTLYVLRGKQQQTVAELGAGDMGAVAKLSNTTTGDTLCDESAQVRFEQLTRVQGVYARSARAPTRADEEKLSEAMARLAEEDIAFDYQRDPETGEMVVTGMGQLHLDIATDRLRRKFGVNVELGEPTIAYRETIRKAASATARHKKQTGGRGQFGECSLRLEPRERGAGFEFVDETKGGVIPNQYIPGVEKGAAEAMREGVVVGFPVVDVRVAVYDGKDHPVDSSELAFRIAAHMAFKQAALEAEPVLLEPIVELEVTTPEEFLGDIISDLNGRRARVQGTEGRAGNQVIRCLVPLAEILNYEAQLRSTTQGRASYSIRPSRYEEVPAHLAQRIVAAHQKQKAES
jgi:elongation factor G